MLKKKFGSGVKLSDEIKKEMVLFDEYAKAVFDYYGDELIAGEWDSFDRLPEYNKLIALSYATSTFEKFAKKNAKRYVVVDKKKAGNGGAK